jgi:ribosomal protein S18
MAFQQRRFQRRKFCKFCSEKTQFIDYKDLRLLRRNIALLSFVEK